jgi:hypothetical protein
MTVYDPSSILEALFSSSARVRLLCLFLTTPGRPFYQREIERETGQPIRAVQREVERLEAIGLLLRSSEGNRVFYRVNPGFPLLAELSALFQKAMPDAAREPAAAKAEVPPEAWARHEPFEWMETPPQQRLPDGLRKSQVEGEWDRAY